MVRSIEGVYRNGKVELLEPAPPVADARVIVTFLSSSRSVDLAERGISPDQAAEIRAGFACFEEDWNRPEMDVYDTL